MKKGILLINLGSPDSTKTKDVRRYLKEFLSDKKVIDVWYVRNIILHLFILPFRPKKSAEAYRKIWWKEGSPLIVLTERLQKKMQEKTDYPIEIGMRYGNPSIKSGLQKLKDQGCDDILVIPLYPQYAMSTTETVIEKTLEVWQKYFSDLKLEFLPPFYDNSDYVEVLAESIKSKLPKNFDKLLFSYHGVPERHIKKTNDSESCRIRKSVFKKEILSDTFCYETHCYRTTELVGEVLDLGRNKIQQAFQSRLGFDPWLQPYTDATLKGFPAQGVKKIAVVAPAFVSDCLETLEEIAMEGKEEFIEAGGEEFTYIPCLNDSEEFVNLMVKWCNEFIEKS